MGGGDPAACLRDRERTRTVTVGDQVRGATVAAIIADGVVLARGSRSATVAPRSATRPLANLPFAGGASAPSVRVVVSTGPQMAAPPAPAGRRRLGIAVRDGVLGRGGVEIAGITRTDLDLLPGDRLLEIDGKPVTSSADAARLLATCASAPSVALRLRREDRTFVVTASWKEEP